MNNNIIIILYVMYSHAPVSSPAIITSLLSLTVYIHVHCFVVSGVWNEAS